MVKTIKIVKQNGLVLNKDYTLKSLDNLFNIITNGEHSLTISKLVKKRTPDQNRLMWLWFTCIEIETGTLKNDIHDYYCLKFLSRKVVINGSEQIVTSGTSKLNTLSMKDFLDKVQSDAASEFGIKLPNPDDLIFKEFEEHFKHFIY